MISIIVSCIKDIKVTPTGEKSEEKPGRMNVTFTKNFDHVLQYIVIYERNISISCRHVLLFHGLFAYEYLIYGYKNHRHLHVLSELVEK